MPQMTLTEQQLARTWADTPDDVACWLDLHNELKRASRLLVAVGAKGAAHLYDAAAMHALDRSVYRLSQPRIKPLHQVAEAA